MGFFRNPYTHSERSGLEFYTRAAGQTVAHVETLRIQNMVTAPADGRIVEVLVADRTPVEYGQPLLVIRPTDV